MFESRRLLRTFFLAMFASVLIGAQVWVPQVSANNTVPSAPVLGGNIRILADNDFALLAGDEDNVTRMILQNDAVWMDQQQAAATYQISLAANETYLYLLAMGGGGDEDIGGLLNGVDITEISPGPNGIQRATGRSDGSTADGFLLLDPFFSDWRTVGFAGTDVNVEYGKYSASFAAIQTALTGATWGNPPNHQTWGVGSFITGRAFDVPSEKAVMYRFKGTSLGGGFVSAGDSSANVSWSPPTSDGGSLVLDYTVRAYRASDNSDTGRTCTTPNATTRECTVTGLTNGVAYYFKITARNAVGVGPASAATASVTPNDFTAPTVALSAPSGTQTSNTSVFTVSADEALDCSTLSATSGVDLNVSGGALASVSQASSATCAVTVTTAVAQGSSGTVSVTRASGFSVTDLAGNAQTALAGSPAVTTVSIPSVVTTSTSVAPSLELIVQAPTTSNPSVVTPVVPTPSVPAQSGTSRRDESPESPTLRGGESTVGPTSSTRSASPTTSVPTTTIPAPPDAPDVEPGAAVVETGGERIEPTISRRDNQLVIVAGEITALLAGVDQNGEVAPLDPDGNVRLREGSKVRLRAEGFAPGSTVEAWLFSTPIRLGSAKVDSSGVMQTELTIPAGVPAGAHRIVIEATNRDGKETTLAVGIAIGDYDRESGVATWLIITPIVLAVFGAMVLPAVYRRRRATA